MATELAHVIEAIAELNQEEEFDRESDQFYESDKSKPVRESRVEHSASLPLVPNFRKGEGRIQSVSPRIERGFGQYNMPDRPFVFYFDPCFIRGRVA